MAWLAGALAVVCLAVAVLHLLRLVVVHRDIAGDASFAAMGLGMAVMFSPLGEPVPAPVWTVVFVLAASWFAALALRNGVGGGETTHHVVGSGAMLFMLAAGHTSGDPAADGAPAGHVAHGGGVEGGLGLASVVAIVLAGYFAWHALRCADRCGLMSTDPTPDDPAVDAVPTAAAGRQGGAVALRAPVSALGAPRVAALAHLVMAVAMTVMLLGMV